MSRFRKPQYIQDLHVSRAILAAAAIVALSLSAAPLMAVNPPNILFILTENIPT